MALNKTISANGAKGHHTFTLSVNEDSTQDNKSILSFSFIISPIQQGWNWSGWGGNISYSISIGSNTYSGTIPSYDGYSTVTLYSGSNIEITHDSDGKKTISVSFSVSDGANQRYTCGNASANDTFTLSDLHKAPVINSITITEMNAQLTSLSIANDLIIQYLSQKKFTISASTYDSATISSYNVYYNNALIGTSSSNQVTVNFASVGELTLANNKVGLQIQIVDSKDGITSQNYTYNVIQYTKPTLENTSSTIKRKTGNGTNLTDNKANLNFIGTCYKVNNTIGNNNTQQVQYKVWVRGGTEPSYTNVSSTVSGNNVTITNYEISNILYTLPYSYKIKITDSFGNSAEKTNGTIPTGTSVWSEYKDRVNFIKATVNDKDVLTTDSIETGSNANGKWIKFPNGTLICTKQVTSSVTMTTRWGQLYDGTMNLGNWPMTFTELWSVSYTNITNVGAMVESAESAPSTTFAGTIYLARAISATYDITMDVIGIGTWK